jgi:hypothetical protein
MQTINQNSEEKEARENQARENQIPQMKVRSNIRCGAVCLPGCKDLGTSCLCY